MRAVMESAFSVAYLITVLILGCGILRRHATLPKAAHAQHRLFGVMTLVLGAGDAFHLAPRVAGLLGPGLEHYTAALGLGTLVTSVTMTVFHVMLYHVLRLRYQRDGRQWLTALIYALAAVRIVLCLFPQNRWTDADAPTSWGIYRNIPFAALGLVVTVLVCREASSKQDTAFRHMWLAISLSFAFYIPVVLWADAHPAVGMLMLPKTCAYVWMIWMGYRDLKSRKKPKPAV